MNAELVRTTGCPESTRSLGRRIGERLRAASVITMQGDLGSGKTVLIQGLAKGLDVPAGYPVTSPTYTLVNEYPGRIKLYHVDLYRLEGENDFEELGLYEILEDDAVVAIEWADRLGEGRPDHRLDIRMSIIDDRTRQIRLTACGLPMNNLIRSLEQ